MTFLQSILLGLIQGVAEFLPISSSGHLAIAQNLLNINAEVPAFYDVLLHLGTLVAVFVAYWQDICDMVREFFCGIGDLVHHSTPTPVPPARRLILLIILGTLPLFAILPIKDTVEGLKNSMVFIGAALIVTGFLLFFSDRARKGRKDARSATVLDVLVVGVSQAIATVPGISRSGMTITTGCFVGFERRFAVRFSFLLSIPAVLGANILSLKDALTGGNVVVDGLLAVDEAVAAQELYAQIQQEKQRLIAAGKIKKEKSLPEITEDEKPFDIPESWMWVRLKNIASVLYGYPFDSTKFNTHGEGLPLIRIRDVLPAKSATYTTESVSEDYVVHDGDMLIGMDGNFNIAFWNGGNAYLNQRVCKVVTDERLITARFLYHYFPNYLDQVFKTVSFVTVRHLSDKHLTSMIVPLPPLAEQQRIVEKMNSLVPYVQRFE